MLNNATRRASLEYAVRLDIARALSVHVRVVVVNRMALGSLVVNFTIVSDTNDGAAVAADGTTRLTAETLQATFDAATSSASSASSPAAPASAAAGSGWLVNTSALYGTETQSNETLIVTSSTSEVVAVPVPPPGPTTSGPGGLNAGNADEGGCGRACVAFYVAAAVGVVLVIGAAVGIALLVRRRQGTSVAQAAGAKTAGTGTKYNEATTANPITVHDEFTAEPVGEHAGSRDVHMDGATYEDVYEYHGDAEHGGSHETAGGDASSSNPVHRTFAAPPRGSYYEDTAWQYEDDAVSAPPSADDGVSAPPSDEDGIDSPPPEDDPAAFSPMMHPGGTYDYASQRRATSEPYGARDTPTDVYEDQYRPTASNSFARRAFAAALGNASASGNAARRNANGMDTVQDYDDDYSRGRTRRWY